MKIPINDNSTEYFEGPREKQRIFLNSVTLLKYFLNTDDYIDTLITCRGTELELTTHDYNLYEALGSLKPYDNFNINRLVKLLEVVKVTPYENREGKKVLTEKRVEELRKEALRKD
ncbi:MAG: hypothetical protein QXU20_02655 [Candidatus Woesearchaeota archaeon]